MSRITKITVQELARESGADLDEVLVTLWDLGIDDVLGPSDMVPRGQISEAKRALGVATRDEIRSLEYWRMLLGLSDKELSILLRDLDFPIRQQARRVPQGAVSKLKLEARRRGIDPLTGRIGLPPAHVLRHTPENGAQGPSQVDEFQWRTLGHERSLRYLTEDEVRAIHFALVQDFEDSDDPMDPPGIRSEHLLASAVFRPQTSNGDELKYPTVETAAAALLHAIIQDHPFHNGNKRTALVSMLVMIDENGILLSCDQDELFKIVLQVAQHRVAKLDPRNLADREVLAIADWICQRSRLVEKGEKPMPWRKLRRILRQYGCHMERPPGTGRINVTRKKIERGFLGFTETETLLRTQVFYGDEGRDIEVDTIKKIREDLQLDDVHGIDSRNFYGGEPEPADFIAKYRKTLYRLAKL